MAVYPPKYERRLRLNLQEFRNATVQAGHPWECIDITTSFERWMAGHEYAEAYFEEPDLNKFPCLALAYEALRMGGVAPAVLNAANEQAVALFLKEAISFTDIPQCIERALEVLYEAGEPSVDEMAEADLRARNIVLELAKLKNNRRQDLRII
jgi:1-deoxy-D-xylulose 5-phosphate reductoisomerase